MNQYFTAAVNHSWIHCKASSLGDWFISKLNGIPRCTWASHLQPQTTGGDTDSRLTGCLLSTTALTKLHHRWRPGPSHQRVTWFNQDQKILRQINRVLLCGSLLILAPLHDTVSVLSAFTWGEVGVPVYSGRPCVVHVGHSNNNKNQWSASGEKKKKVFKLLCGQQHRKKVMSHLLPDGGGGGGVKERLPPFPHLLLPLPLHHHTQNRNNSISALPRQTASNWFDTITIIAVVIIIIIIITQLLLL